MQIEEKKVDEEQSTLIKHKGSSKDLVGLINELMAWIEDNEIEVAGQPFAIYYGIPQKRDDILVYDVGVPVSGDVVGTDRIAVGSVPEHTVLSGKYKGAHYEIKSAYDEMVDFVNNSTYDVIGSPREVYHNLPDEVEDSELITEIQFPVINMG